MNMVAIHEQLSLEEKDFMVQLWNLNRNHRITIPILPFVSSQEMKAVMREFTKGIEDGDTMMFPRFPITSIVKYMKHIEETLDELDDKSS